ncbi:50S ribosomal protein L2, chloroplastic [Balamuthia mandrillaris]
MEDCSKGVGRDIVHDSGLPWSEFTSGTAKVDKELFVTAEGMHAGQFVPCGKKGLPLKNLTKMHQTTAEVKVLRNKGEAAGVYSRDAVMKSLWYPTENICFLLDCIVPRNWTFGGHSWMTHDCNKKCCQVTTTVPSFPADFCCRDVVVNGIQRRPFCPAPAEDSHTIGHIIEHHENNPDYVSVMPTTGMTKVCGTRAYKWDSTANLDELQTACHGELSLTSSNKYNWTGTAYAPEVYYQKGVSETRFGSSFSKSQPDYWAFTDSDHFADMFRPGGAYVDKNDPTSLQEFFDTQDAHDLLDYGILYNRVNLLNRAYPADKQYITNLDYAPLSCNATEAPNVYYDEGTLKIWIPAGSKCVTYTNDGGWYFHQRLCGPHGLNHWRRGSASNGK